MSSMSQMSSLLPGGTGILLPKQVNRFVVRWNCVFDPTPAVSAKDAEQHLARLTTQIVRVASIPTEVFDQLVRTPRAKPPLIDIMTIGVLELVFEDDMAGLTQEALDFLAYGGASRIKVVVAKLDDIEGIAEAHVYGQCKLKQLRHHELDYRGAVEVKDYYAKMTDKSPDHIDVNGTITDGRLVRKTLVLEPSFAMRGSKGLNMNQLLSI